jgi:hypothetical protein
MLRHTLCLMGVQTKKQALECTRATNNWRLSLTRTPPVVVMVPDHYQLRRFASGTISRVAGNIRSHLRGPPPPPACDRKRKRDAVSTSASFGVFRDLPRELKVIVVEFLFESEIWYTFPCWGDNDYTSLANVFPLLVCRWVHIAV